MKRSEAKANLLREMRSVGLGEWRNELVERALAVFERMGEVWDPEAPEWPELKAVPGGVADGGSVLEPFNMLTVGGRFESRTADRIARAWNARRPGGEVERRLDTLAHGLANGRLLSYAQVALHIQSALRLGVEEP